MSADGFEGRRAAITGAGGFIGGALARRLLAEGATVIGIDVSPGAADRLAEAGIEVAICDVTDAQALERAFAGCDHVFHTAAHVHEWGPMEEFVRVNVGGTASVLAAAACPVVHVSSVVVYGYDAEGEQDESAGLRTYGIPYIDTKSASDRIARRGGAVVVRPGDVYGPASVPWLIRPLELAASGRLSVPGAGDGIMLPIFVDDLVEALLAAATRGRPGRAYAAWDGAPVTFYEYFSRIAEIGGRAGPRRLPRAALELAGGATERWSRLRGQAPPFTSRSPTFIDRRGTVSNRRARAELGWEPRVGLDEGLARCAEWARSAGIVARGGGARPARGGGRPADD